MGDSEQMSRERDCFRRSFARNDYQVKANSRRRREKKDYNL